jgi:hypothetical protein
MIFAKEVITGCVTLGMGVGCFLGGLSMAYSDHIYNRALEDPDFFYLVDELGNPVRQELDQS